MVLAAAVAPSIQDPSSWEVRPRTVDVDGPRGIAGFGRRVTCEKL